ncbi:nucleotidyltransferase domain-containing protein [Mycoplasmatota bacterium WC30]
MVEKLIKELASLDEVEAVLLGGSRATGTYDDKSDYDYYVYLNKPLSENKRRNILNKYCSYMEYSNKFWELEDDGKLNNGLEIELIYREIDSIDEMLDGLVNKGYVSHGYTTCYLDNVLNSKIIVDKNDIVANLKEKYKHGLSNELIKKIIDYNYPIIYEQMPALYKQVKKAVERNDLHSINHRVTAYFEMYYDIVFALNNKTHPGEKRLLELTLKLDKKPEKMEELINQIFLNIFHDNDKMLLALKVLSLNLKKLLENEKLIER